MYCYNLKISIFSKDTHLEEIIRSICPLAGFKHEIESSDIDDISRLPESDILVWDLSGRPSALRESGKVNKALIFCADADSIKNFDMTELGAADDFWERPLHYDRIAVRFRHLLEKIKLAEDLYLSNTCLSAITDNIPDMLWIKTLDGTHTFVNNEFCSIVGKTKKDVTGRDHCYIWGVSPDDPNSGADICRQTEEAVIAKGHRMQFTEQVKGQKGMRQFITFKSPLYDRNHNVLGTVGYGHDITELENMYTENKILLNSMPYAVLIRDKGGKISEVNPKFEETFNIRKEDVIGTFYNDWAECTFRSERMLNEEGFKEAVTKSPNNDKKVMELRQDNICDFLGNVTGQICIFRDVTIERQLEAQIVQNANTDFLTGLYNRRYLYEYVQEHCIGKKLSLLSVDLDHFKDVNDTYGHHTGDEALMITSRLLQECFPNDLVVRMGGDEFLILRIGSCSIQELEQDAQTLLDKLYSTYAASENLRMLSASVGITQSHDSQGDIDMLLRQSDIALYQAKENGRGRYWVYDKGEG
ncbi:MAG: diguanylate cyclase [Lachnospiraceae bacterium]|nr:diguanylate cyclase [Lachnospiraceae bacterium]